ncbi:TadE/TadG family type IV pilus assembly protein [Isoptericola sp. b490]|uniref:TadE/TadG family type IV pilus assembly protein n=1 Tax=Actinotalea lenta TaxID=3064654 RepID=UPI002712D924|nr:TadE/TadG family type IV pilus assembly protein [Isoptericola sp. b490]MDO8119702.1 TadE/TadG family type IV pilus assembly protein [Isoptericola sp. b490]
MTLELAVIAPFLLLLLGALVLVGRVQVAGGAVEQAARSAAREASIARTADAARTAAQEAADRELTAAGVACVPASVSVDTAGFAAALGQAAVVRVEVRCTVTIDDLAIPGLPGDHTMTAHAVSPLDRYRSR